MGSPHPAPMRSPTPAQWPLPLAPCPSSVAEQAKTWGRLVAPVPPAAVRRAVRPGGLRSPCPTRPRLAPVPVPLAPAPLAPATRRRTAPQ